MAVKPPEFTSFAWSYFDWSVGYSINHTVHAEQQFGFSNIDFAQ